ncbi:MAG: AAA family ATPase [Ruminococcus sp.]|nr:AAA family ATPase [Ruminococcus sp.]
MIGVKEMTALNSSVGADEGQSPKTGDYSINDLSDDCKAFDVSELSDKPGFKTVTMSQLFDSVYQGKPPIIDGLLYRGIYLFVGAPKIGKSFFMAQLAYHVSSGTQLWDYPVRKGTVLYLALEDDYARLQKRMYRMFGTTENKNLFFAVSADCISKGLDKQVDIFVREYPDTSLIIIDTLQKVREAGGDNYSYANDYQIIASLKGLASRHGICLLLVHHTRKQNADDKFDMISGTNGLLGAADGAFLLAKDKRTSNNATLDVSGRDQQDLRMFLMRDTDTLAWRLDKVETELWKSPPEPLLDLIAEKITGDTPQWSGTPTELCDLLQTDLKPNALTQKLNVNAARLREEHNILYNHKRSHDGRRITLSFIG